MTMLKPDIIKSMTTKTDLTQDKCRAALEAFLSIVEENIIKGNEVKISGFGTFATSERSARKSRNPKSGEDIEVPAKIMPKFTFSRKFKEDTVVTL